MMNLGRTIAALVIPILFVGASSQIVGCLDDLKAGTGASDAGDDGALSCSHAMPPLPPTIADDVSSDVTFVAAIRQVYFAMGPQGEPLGLDLDRFCSCQGETPSCVAPSGQDPTLQCDGPGGRDNGAEAFFKLISLILSLDGTTQLSELCSEYANLGRWSVLVRVSGYNGQPDDPQVRVDWLPSFGMTPPPQWQGDDIWPVSVGAMEPDGGPRYYDQDAYVSKGQLVFSLVEGNMQMGNGLLRLDINFNSSTAMATIEKDASGRYGLRNGVLAGRIPMDEMFKMITAFRDHNGSPFCAGQNNPYYNAARDAFCRGPDIQVGSPQPNKPCNAISLGLGFQADSIGGVGTVEGPPNGAMECPPGADPFSVYVDAGCPSIP